MRKLITDLKENEVIHCSTEKEAIAICKLMHEAGLKWCSGRSYLEEHSYFLFKENTCYYPKTGEYASIDWYKNGNYTIYKASDFLTSIYEVGKEYEFSDNEKEWCKRNYLCITSKGEYVHRNYWIYKIIIPRKETYTERFDNKENEVVDGVFNPETWGKRYVDETQYLLSTNTNKEILLEDVLKTKDRIMSETSEETKKKARDYGNSLVDKQQIKKHLIDIMQEDENLGLYDETLKEVAERYVDGFEFGIAHPRRVTKNAFINGAKWQQEQTPYSDEDLKKAYHFALLNNDMPFDIWLNYFKNKK